MTSKIEFPNIKTQKYVVTATFLMVISLLSACASTNKSNKDVSQTVTNKPTNIQVETKNEIKDKKSSTIKAVETNNAAEINKAQASEKTIAPSKTPKPTNTKNTTSKQATTAKKSTIKTVSPKEAIAIKVAAEPEIILTSLDQTPLTLSNGWVVKIATLPLSNSELCILYNERKGVFDGYKDNNVKLYLTTSQLVIQSDSNFDLTYPETGLYVENNEKETLVESLTMSSQQNIALSTFSLNNYLDSAPQSLTVKSGFWPSWPITETRTISFSMNEISQMVTTLNTCSSLLTSQ